MEGYTVELVPDAKIIDEKIKDFEPELILLDILMSGNDGRIICKRLKEANDTKHLPIIMMSAHPTAKQDSQNCGADGFIPKPFEIDSVVQIIKSKTE